MRLTFHIDYQASPGESLRLSGWPSQLGVFNPEKAVEMRCEGRSHWIAEVKVPDNTPSFGYRYFVMRADGSRREEYGEPHVFEHGSHPAEEYDIYDAWKDMPEDRPFYSSAFTKSIFRREKPFDKTILPATGALLLSVEAAGIESGRQVALCGSETLLGEWDPGKALRMSDADFPTWKCLVPATLGKDSEFKFIIIDKASNEIIEWEEGSNRKLGIELSEGKATTIDCGFFRLKEEKWKGTGTAVPLFSIRTENDWGVGDFADIPVAVDWLEATGQSILQLLPVNDTTSSGTTGDSYPYSAISSFALHPMYLRPEKAGKLRPATRMTPYLKAAKKLNALTEVDYTGVNELKLSYIKELYEQDGEKCLSSSDFRKWFLRNSEWLKPYTAYCLLRDRKGTADFGQWGEESKYSPTTEESVLNSAPKEAGRIYFTQYHLSKQLREAKLYGREKHVALKGDIPIGVSRYSADAWAYPRLFNMDCQAGAPPDAFSKKGQNWGFPTYNWKEMAKDGYGWWKSRLHLMSKYFDAYRIDHLLGFFRIWEIPIEQTQGIMGVFSPALPFSMGEMCSRYGFKINGEMLKSPLPPTLSCQRKIETYFGKKPKTEESRELMHEMMNMAEDVLFLADKEKENHYHPRIEGEKTEKFKSLDGQERESYLRLSHDYFYGRQDQLWKESAMTKLPALTQSTAMLACGEDLGMIPACVPEVMRELKILSLEIERMPKIYGQRFGQSKNYPYYSVSSPSTHDMPGIRVWWEEDRERSQAYYREILGKGGDMPTEATPEICHGILKNNLAGNSMLCIIPIQDWLSISGQLRRPDAGEETINVPSDAHHYWRYRMHVSFEKLLESDPLNKEIKALAKRN